MVGPQHIRQVLWRATQSVRLVLTLLGKPEVNQLQVPACIQQQVLRLELCQPERQRDVAHGKRAVQGSLVRHAGHADTYVSIDDVPIMQVLEHESDLCCIELSSRVGQDGSIPEVCEELTTRHIFHDQVQMCFICAGWMGVWYGRRGW